MSKKYEVRGGKNVSESPPPPLISFFRPGPHTFKIVPPPLIGRTVLLTYMYMYIIFRKLVKEPEFAIFIHSHPNLLSCFKGKSLVLPFHNALASCTCTCTCTYMYVHPPRHMNTNYMYMLSNLWKFLGWRLMVNELQWKYNCNCSFFSS